MVKTSKFITILLCEMPEENTMSSGWLECRQSDLLGIQRHRWDLELHNASEAVHRKPPGSSALRESEASAANVFCSESKATATKHSVGTEINPLF